MLWWSLLACDDGGTVDRTGETDADADSDADSDADADTDADSDADVDPPEERCTAVVRVDLGSDGNWDREGLDRLDPADPQRLLGTERGPLGGPVDDAWSWTRDPAGNLLTEVHEVDGATVLAVTHTRDADGNEVLLEEDLDGDGAWDVVAATTWVGGAAVARTWDLDGDGIVDRWDTLTNDGEGRVTAVKGHADAAGTVLVYQEQHDYDADRGSSGRTLFDLDGTLPAEEQLRERYDAEGRAVYRGLSTGAPRFADLVEDEDWAWDAAGYLSRHRERTFGVDVSGYPLDLYVDDLFARDAAGQVVTQTSELGVFLDLGPVQQTTALATDLTVRAASPCP